MDRRTRTAYHEAGHAVACLKLGRGFLCVTIVPDQDSDGEVKRTKAPKSKSERWLEREVLISLAGLAAEKRYVGRTDWKGARSDTSQASDLMLGLFRGMPLPSCWMRTSPTQWNGSSSLSRTQNTGS
jgi:ATP-dependent Zn protease